MVERRVLNFFFVIMNCSKNIITILNLIVKKFFFLLNKLTILNICVCSFDRPEGKNQNKLKKILIPPKHIQQNHFKVNENDECR